MNDTGGRRDPVEELAEEFARRLRRGERPSLSEYTTRHPELAAEIRDLFPAMVVMEQFGSVADQAAPPARTAAPPRLGDFRIVREVGRGGMGVVYEAVQESLGRHVALKVLSGGPPTPGPARERFRREAKAAARLHHTNIVPVFAVGEDGGTSYYAMQFIRGQGLDAVLAEVRRLRADGTATHVVPASGVARILLTGSSHSTADREAGPEVGGPSARPPSTTGDLAAQPEARYCREVARLGVQAAEALHYAHLQGVLHRDVKPGNLLLDAGGTLWVTDFGLAKASDSDDLTGTGDLIGTVRYMAPERFRGRADARSDVYSLGVTLYELLALRAAFDDTDRLRMIDRIGREDPPRLRRVAADVPRDLETVVHKAAARSPADRYASAQDLADDLRRFLDGRPVKARRHGWAEQGWRWCRRKPAVASLAAAVILLLAAVAVGASVSAVHLGRALTQANDNLTRAVSAEIDADANRWRGHLLDARSSRLSRASGQRFAALASLRQAVGIARGRGMPAERFAEMRTEAIAALALPDLYVEAWWDGRPAGEQWLSFGRDLDTYARVHDDGSVSVRRTAGDTEIAHLTALDGRVGIHLNPDGRSLLQFQADPPYRGRLWDLSGDRPAVRAEETDVEVYSRYRPDGRLLALPHRDGAISVYDPATGRRVYRLPPLTVVNTAWIDLHPRAPLAAVSSYFHRDVLVRDLRTGAVVARLVPPWAGGGYATWHPSGRFLCVGAGDSGEVRVYDFDPATAALTYRRSVHTTSTGGTEMVFNAGGDRGLIVGWNSTLSLVDFSTGRVVFVTPTAPAATPQFDPPGRRLAGAGRRDGSGVGIWSVSTAPERRVVAHGRPPVIRTPAVSPDGRVAAVTLYADGLVLFDLVAGRELATVPFRAGSWGRAGSAVFEPSGALLTNSWDGCFRWPVRADPADPGRLQVGPPERLPFHSGELAVAASRDGRVVAQAMDTGYGMGAYAGGWILTPDRPGEPRRVMPDARGYHAAVSPDGRWVAFGLHTGGGVRVFATADGRPARDLPGGRGLFTPDGRWLATDADGGRLYAVGTWAPGPQLGPGELFGLSADGRLAAFGLDDGQFRLVAVETGRELARLEDPDHFAGAAALAPDGTRLVALTRDGVCVWDLLAIRHGLADLGLDWDAPPLPPASTAGPVTEVRVVGVRLLDPRVRAWQVLIECTGRLLAAPDDVAARLRRAAAARYVGWLWLAEWDYAGVLVRQPAHPTARRDRGGVALDRDRPAAALADFDDVLRRDPADRPTRARPARALARLGRYRDAAADADRLLAHDPRDGPLHTLRGQCRTALGDRTGAEADLRAAVDLDPNQPNAANDLAWFLATGPDPRRAAAEALPLARRAVERAPEHWSYRNTLGVVLYRLGRDAEAIACLSESLAHSGGDAAAWDLYFLAMCRHRQGDPARAKDDYARAVRWEGRATGLTPRERAELDAFRAEAAAALGIVP